MKFEQKYIDAKPSDKYEFEYSFVTRSPKLDQCRNCGSFTKWLDLLFQVPVCSEECNSLLWRQYKKDEEAKNTYDNFEKHFAFIKRELEDAQEFQNCSKDILIVVKDQLSYFKDCVESIKVHTKNYHLYIWDNGSHEETRDYIESLSSDTITTARSQNNTGFIFPNNEMISWGKSDSIILLNSDTKVFENWDSAMIAVLRKQPDIKQVGYWGGHLDSDGRGFGGANGFDVDYIPGWCFCIDRKTYEENGLFSPHLTFAYCEDADFSLRLKEKGHKIYALHAPLVHHYQNKTIIEVEKEGEIDVRATFEHNHNYLKSRWENYLKNERIQVKNSQKLPILSNL